MTRSQNSFLNMVIGVGSSLLRCRPAFYAAAKLHG